MYCRFNTSYVNVYRGRVLKMCQRQQSFNTSHVNVYPVKEVNKRRYKTVSIHPMLMFIKHKNWNCSCAESFNTSHVNVYHFLNNT